MQNRDLLSLANSYANRPIQVVSGQHEQPRYALYVANRDGANRRKITDDTFVNAYYPAWSPDGKAIVFVARRGDDGSVDLYSIDPAGGVPDRLTNTPERIESSPTFSPDGEFIAFAESDGAHIDIYKMQRDGTDVTLLTKTEDDERDYDPAWSPDGQYIAFWTQASFGGQSGDSEGIYMMKSDGSERQQIIQHGCYPAWRPIGGDMGHN